MIRQININAFNPKLKYIGLALALAIVLMVGVIALKMYLAKPNPYEWHYDRAAGALETDLVADAIILAVQEDMAKANEMMDKNDTDNAQNTHHSTNTQKPQDENAKIIDNNSTKLAIDVVNESINTTKQNVAIVKQVGGIADFDDIASRKTHTPSTEHLQHTKEIERTIMQAGGRIDAPIADNFSDGQLGASSHTGY